MAQTSTVGETDSFFTRGARIPVVVVSTMTMSHHPGLFFFFFFFNSSLKHCSSFQTCCPLRPAEMAHAAFQDFKKKICWERRVVFLLSAACFNRDLLESALIAGDLYAWFQNVYTALAASSLDTYMDRQELLFFTIIRHPFK